MSKSLLLCVPVVFCVSLALGANPVPVESRDASASSPAGGEPTALNREEIIELLRFRGCNLDFLSQWQPSELLDLLAWSYLGIRFEGDWSSEGLHTALKGLDMSLDAFQGDQEVLIALLGISIENQLNYQVCADCIDNANHYAFPRRHMVVFDSNPDIISFLHESGHVVDHFLAERLGTDTLWWSERGLIGLGWNEQIHQSGEAKLYYLDNQRDAPHSHTSPSEDFADGYAAWVLSRQGQALPRGWRPPSPRRVAMLSSIPSRLRP